MKIFTSPRLPGHSAFQWQLNPVGIVVLKLLMGFDKPTEEERAYACAHYCTAEGNMASLLNLTLKEVEMEELGTFLHRSRHYTLTLHFTGIITTISLRALQIQ